MKFFKSISSIIAVIAIMLSSVIGGNISRTNVLSAKKATSSLSNVFSETIIIRTHQTVEQNNIPALNEHKTKPHYYHYINNLSPIFGNTTGTSPPAS